MLPVDRTLLYIWKRHSLYMGAPFCGDGITYGSHALIVSLDGHNLTLNYTASPVPLEVPLALVPAGVQLKLSSTNAAIACLFLDPLGPEFSLLSQCMTAKTGEIFHDGVYDAAFLRTLSTIWMGHFTTLSAAELLASAFPDPESIAFRHKVDEKVVRVLELITREPSKNISNETLADEVGLSEVQLRRVFKSTVGVPIRRYRLWHRLFVVMRLLAGGQTLTSAALDSGFSDSSHFNHVFRDAFGVNPSTVLKKNGVLRVFVSHEFSKEDGSAKRRQTAGALSSSSRKLQPSYPVA